MINECFAKFSLPMVVGLSRALNQQWSQNSRDTPHFSPDSRSSSRRPNFDHTVTITPLLIQALACARLRVRPLPSPTIATSTSSNSPNTGVRMTRSKMGMRMREGQMRVICTRWCRGAGESLWRS